MRVFLVCACLISAAAGAGELPSSGQVGGLQRGPDGKLILVAPPADAPRDMPATGMETPYFTPTAEDHQTKVRSMQAEINALMRGEIRGRDGQPTAREQALIENLKARDAEVRAHEHAHFMAGRPHTSPPTYFTVVGPDGKSYAVSGQTPTDMSLPTGDPEAAIAKLSILKRSALAPLHPSNSDRQWAMQIDATLAQMRDQRR
ncbi:hypothetical protein JCM17960_01870 [Magnetospira thiophila]